MADLRGLDKITRIEDLLKNKEDTSLIQDVPESELSPLQANVDRAKEFEGLLDEVTGLKAGPATGEVPSPYMKEKPKKISVPAQKAIQTSQAEQLPSGVVESGQISQGDFDKVRGNESIDPNEYMTMNEIMEAGGPAKAEELLRERLARGESTKQGRKIAGQEVKVAEQSQKLQQSPEQEQDDSKTGAAIADSLAVLSNIFNKQQEGGYQLPVKALDNLEKSKKELQKRKDKLEKERLDREYKQKLLDLKRRELTVKKAKAGSTLSKGEEAVDKVYAKEYGDYIAAGGKAQTESEIGKLGDIETFLSKNQDIFDNTMSEHVLQGVGRSLTNPRLQDVKDRLEQIIQQDLRKTLGAQFTEREGAEFLKRSFNPKLGYEQNQLRLKEFIAMVKTRAKARDASSTYFEKHGTLKGFKGARGTSKEVPETKEVRRKTSDGRTAIFDGSTKKFIRYEE